VTRAVFEAAKGGLKVVGRAGVGVDNVDLAAATEVGRRGAEEAGRARLGTRDGA
jgi:phosphoglycerate dehydrogenase-like enzyme